MTGPDREDRRSEVWDPPEQTSDDRDVGWGDDLPDRDGDRDDERLRADRPPHHEDRDD